MLRFMHERVSSIISGELGIWDMDLAERLWFLIANLRNSIETVGGWSLVSQDK